MDSGLRLQFAIKGAAPAEAVGFVLGAPPVFCGVVLLISAVGESVELEKT